jgi:hypothetical protein
MPGMQEVIHFFTSAIHCVRIRAQHKIASGPNRKSMLQFSEDNSIEVAVDSEKITGLIEVTWSQ